MFGIGTGLIGIACSLCLVPSILYLNNLTHHMFNHNTGDMIASIIRVSYGIGLILGPILGMMFLFEPHAYSFEMFTNYWYRVSFDSLCFYWSLVSLIILLLLFTLLFCLSWKWRIHYVTPPASYAYFQEHIKKYQQTIASSPNKQIGGTSQHYNGKQTGGNSNLSANTNENYRKSPLLSQIAGISNVSGLTAMTGLAATAHGNNMNRKNRNKSSNSNANQPDRDFDRNSRILAQILGVNNAAGSSILGGLSGLGVGTNREYTDSNNSGKNNTNSMISISGRSSSQNDITLNLQYCMEFNPLLMDDNSFLCFKYVSCFCTIAFCCQYFSKYYYKQKKIAANLEKYEALYQQVQKIQAQQFEKQQQQQRQRNGSNGSRRQHGSSLHTSMSNNHEQRLVNQYKRNLINSPSESHSKGNNNNRDYGQEEVAIGPGAKGGDNYNYNYNKNYNYGHGRGMSITQFSDRKQSTNSSLKSSQFQNQNQQQSANHGILISPTVNIKPFSFSLFCM